jgi:DNA polymerase III subunit gamma/tau
MGYISLYRKWRPQSFDEVVGQKYNIQTLKNVLASKRLSHSYIFCGPRGTGKTSTARILAKAVNCEKGITPEPCNKCENCKSITAGSNVDVIEIDAASNRGINEIRELREKVRYLPNSLRKKVYIIDEVHMLTVEAFNALLKVLEEPPEHVIFIMATTEPDKVIPTIMSRCQRFDFNPVPLKLVAGKLKEIAAAEKISITDSAIGLLARYADGSLRDAEGILEQLAAYGDGEIGPGEVVSLLGVVNLDMLFEFVDVLAAGDKKKGLSMIDRVIKDNHNIRDFVSGLLDHLYDIYVVKNYEKSSEIMEIAGDYMDRYNKQAEMLQNEEIEYYIGHFTELLKQVKWGESSKTFFKSFMIQAINYMVLDNSQFEKKVGALVARLDALERKIDSLPGETSSNRNKDPVPDALIAKKIDPEHKKNEGSDAKGKKIEEKSSRAYEKPEDLKKEGRGPIKKSGDDFEFIKKNMDRILDVLKEKKISVYAMFVESVPGRLEENTLYFYLDENKKWHKDHLNKSGNSNMISSVIMQVTGMKYPVVFETVKSFSGASKEDFTDDYIRDFEDSVYENPRDNNKGKEITGNEPEYYDEKGQSSKDKIESGLSQEKTGNDMDKKSGKDKKEDVIEYFKEKFGIKE